MKPHPGRSRRIGVLVLSLAFLCGQHAFAPGAFAPRALAQETAVVKLTLKNHRFEPAEPHAPAGKPFTIEVDNLDGTPAEFESKTLRVEKVVAAGSTITLQIRALAAGRYRFFDDYHEDTTEGFLVVQ
jgi:Cupredoxin-like domain